MQLSVQLTAVQSAAIEAIAKKLRMKPEEAFKVLAFMPVGTDYCEISEFREVAELVAELVLQGELPELANGALAGCIEFTEEARPRSVVPMARHSRS